MRCGPNRYPLFVRISATDWAEGGWDLEQSIELSRRFKGFGVDLVDVSSGGAVPTVKIPVGPGYQVEFAEAIRKEVGIATGAVGMITDPAQADTILSSEQAEWFCSQEKCYAIRTGPGAPRKR